MKNFFTCSRILLIAILTICMAMQVNAQDVEFEGQISIGTMSKVNTADSVVVRLSDGTLAVRDGSTLSEFQILSISNDTIFLTDGGFVQLPASSSSGWVENGNVTSTNNLVGIGTASPKAVLQLYGTGGAGAGSRIVFGDDAYDGDGTVRVFIGELGWQVPSDSDQLQIHGQKGVTYTYNGVAGNIQTAMTMNATGDFLMGSGSKFATGHKLSVDGKIASEEIRVQNEIAWPDYVFSPVYRLMPLDQLNKFIEKHQHLPGIPSAKTVEEDGFELGKMSGKLLEKIEELTLHLIQQKKDIQSLQSQLIVQDQMIKDLKNTK